MKMHMRILRFFGMLLKRFLLKKSFLVLLVLLPLFSLSVSLVSRGDSGIFRVAAVIPERTASIDAMVSRLRSSRIVTYREVKSRNEAAALLSMDSCDAVLLFAEDHDLLLEKSAEGYTQPLIEVLIEEDNVLERLLREKLFAALYPELSYGIYRNFIEELLEEAESAGGNVARPDEQELQTFYRLQASENRLIVFETLDGQDGRSDMADLIESGNYLVYPIRGLLLLLLMILAAAAAVTAEQDAKEGLYVYLPPALRGRIPLLYPAAAMVLAAPFYFFALFLSGTMISPLRELGIYLLFLPAACCFTELLRSLILPLTGRSHAAAASVLTILLPLLFFAELVLCPVFINFKNLRAFQLLLPPYYALQAAASDAYLTTFLLYDVILAAVTATILFFRKR